MKKRQRLETEEQWNAFFSEGGLWEINDGPLHTRLYAQAFCKQTSIKLETAQSLLDSSCALGDTLPVFQKHFPEACLFGCDFSKVAIKRCRARFPDMGSFFVSDIGTIAGTYDVIYSCSTLEHFVTYKEKARSLLQHCKYLCILVPYNEKRNGQDLKYETGFDHVVTFRENSFDFLLHEGLATRIHRPKTFTVPGAWAWTFKDWIIQNSKNIVRPLLNRRIVRNRRSILFEIESRKGR